jgi:hypothetical protein
MFRDMVHEHPVEVAIYAARHDHPFLISEVAYLVLPGSGSELVPNLNRITLS